VVLGGGEDGVAFDRDDELGEVAVADDPSELEVVRIVVELRAAIL
jgi:hypothetical protein